VQTIEALSHRLSSYLEPSQINLVKRAYFYAEQAHDGQKRRSGEAYILIPSPLQISSLVCTWTIKV
jgi:(p)ppGpp synthase/HD superfamily hydrolase